MIGVKREAWLSIDKKPATPYGIGGQILGATLVAIEPDFAVLESEGITTRVSLAAASPPAALTKTSDGPASETGLASILRPLAPNDSSMVFASPPQSSQGTGNAAFLEAIGKAQRDAAGK